VRAAWDVAPEETKNSIASLLKPTFMDKVRGKRVEQKVSFPAQPVQAEVVSPSS